MSKVATKQRTRSLKEANAEAQQEQKARKGIDKRVTTFKGGTSSKDSTGDAGTGSIDFAPMAPNDEQLAKINEFTRSTKTADDLVVFPTLSCNDLYDRDDERFVTDTVKEFAKLPEPYGPVGKSYMVGHDYTKLPVGRIFDVGIKTVDLSTLSSKDASSGATVDSTSKSTFLTNWVYVPKTASNQAFIENLDFGVNWAVSVGVMLDEAKCSLPWCGAPMYMSRLFGAWCAEGHDKGYYYTEDAELDSWGYPAPADPADKGAEKCRTDLYGAKDFYELSQVFLGAQFFAAVSDKSVKGIMKAASARTVPILGLSAKEASLFDKAMPHMPPEALDGVRRFGAKPDEDGILKWTDDRDLVWTFDPEAENPEVMCLGKATNKDGEEGDDGKEAASDEGSPDALGEGSEEQSESADDAADDGEGDDAEDGRVGSTEVEEGDGSDGAVTEDADDDADDEDADDDDSDDDDANKSVDDNSGKEATVSKAAIVRALKGLDVPETVLRAVEGVKGTSLDAVLLPLASKAALGDQFISAKRTEALDWYVKANQTEPNAPVSVDMFNKVLDAAGDNVDLIDHLIGQQKTLAQAKFPATVVRRSSFPTDVNRTSSADPDLAADEDGVHGKSSQTVRNLHG